MKNNKKKYLHNQRNGAFERELVERINLFEEPVRTELLTDFREVSQEETYFYFDKKYKKTMIFDLFAMFYATVFIRHLKKLRKVKNKSASEIDEMLGFTINYPMTSFRNTLFNPTKRNVKIMFGIYRRMLHLNNGKSFGAELTNDIFDYDEIYNRALTIHGYKTPTGVNKKTIESDEISQNKEEKEMIETYELVINGKTVLFDKENSALELLKKIKEQTNIEVEVFETIKEQLI